MTQRSIEMIVGRLVTDEEFRASFLRDPYQALVDLIDRGTHLSHTDLAALMATDEALWNQVAGRVEPRLQKASLKNE